MTVACNRKHRNFRVRAGYFRHGDHHSAGLHPKTTKGEAGALN